MVFKDVTIEAQPPYESGLNGVSCVMDGGSLTLVRVTPGHGKTPLADAAEGLVEAAHGHILFDGAEWRTMSPDQAAACRGLIGRVFEERGWISNLDMDENITLSQRHHTRRSEEEIAQEAEALVRKFGLAELPRARPAMLKRADLRRSEWARAFVGQPRLVILEEPMREVSPEFLPALVEAVKDVCGRGGAVLWITSDAQSWSGAASAAKQCFEYKDGNLVSRGGN